jgi:hypothetical protein
MGFVREELPIRRGRTPIASNARIAILRRMRARHS